MALAWFGTFCWPICFWWMHRVSQRQDAMLTELHDVIKRIEALSKEESELIREVHPTVAKIEESVGQVAAAVSDGNAGSKSDRGQDADA